MSHDLDLLFEELASAGWSKQGAILMAPHETMWLSPGGYPNDLDRFLQDMRSRVGRIELSVANGADVQHGALEDARSALASADRARSAPKER